MRDGDKIDIMRTIADSTVDTILKVDEDTFLASHFSTPALTAFDEHRCVARDERNEPADYLVGLICFMFELVHPASRALAREQGDIYRLLDAPFGITRPFTDPPRRQPGAALRTSCAAGWQALSTRAEPAVPQRSQRHRRRPCTGRHRRWGIRVLIDGNNALRPTDAGEMLDSTRDTDAHEELGRDRYTVWPIWWRYSNQPASTMGRVQPSSAPRHRRAFASGQILLGADAAAHHDQTLGIGN